MVKRVSILIANGHPGAREYSMTMVEFEYLVLLEQQDFAMVRAGIAASKSMASYDELKTWSDHVLGIEGSE